MDFRIPEEKISEIRAATNILDVVSERVLLKRAGKYWTGLCPFHSEKTPSFTVSPEKQIFHCFGCGVGGNVFSFVMKTDGLSFLETARLLAKRYGIEIPEKEMSPARKKAFNERETLYSINDMAGLFFRDNLYSAESSGKSAMGYLEKRGITGQIVKTFGLGLATDSWDGLLRFLRSRGVDSFMAEKAGLVARNDNGGFYDRFRNRVIFPIYDATGRITGFGGRVLDDSKPKYLNSPETALYHKGRSLYGLNLAKAKCRSEGVVYISEGYFDLIAFHQNGVENSVATLGTALTTEQIRILKGHASRMILVYDSDEAGRVAAAKSAGIFLKEAVAAEVLILPEGHDPDSFFREYGPEGFDRISKSGKQVLDFFIDEAIKKYGDSVAGKIQVVDSAVSIISTVEDSLERSLYTKQLAARLDIDDIAVFKRIAGKVPQKNPERPSPQKAVTDIRLDQKMVAMMLQFPDARIFDEIKRRKLVDSFSDETLKHSAERILEIYKGSTFNDFACEVLGKIDDNLKGYLSGLVMHDEVWTYEGCLGLINQFQAAFRNNKKDLLDRIKMAESMNDQRLLMTLLREKQTLAAKNRT